MWSCGTGVIPPILLKSPVTAVRQSQACIGIGYFFLFDNMVHDYIFFMSRYVDYIFKIKILMNLLERI